MIDVVAYGDFNCPFSALASTRVSELEQHGIARFDWRAVEHDADIPAGGVVVAGGLAATLLGELEQIRGLLRPGEPDRLRLPPRQVNTARATRRYAGAAPASRPEVREAIFAAHWERGEGIDDEAVLDGVGAGPDDGDTADAWRAGWNAATTPIVPVLVLPDGYVSRGLGALDRLATMLDG
jgi:hypothetical protein